MRHTQLSGAYSCNNRTPIMYKLHDKVSLFTKKGSVVKEIITDCISKNVHLSETDLYAILDSYFIDTVFSSNRQREIELDEMENVLNRYLSQESRTGYKPATSQITICGENITVEASMRFEDYNDKCIHVTFTDYVYGKTSITNRGRTPDTAIKSNLRLYALLLAAIQDIQAKDISDFIATGEVIFLKHDDDKVGEYQPEMAKKQFAQVTVEYKNNQCITPNIFEAYNESFKEYKEGRKPTSTTCKTCNMYEHCFFSGNEEKPTEFENENHSPIQFSEAQNRIIDFNKGIARVIAGAGAGKTTVTVEHAAKLIRNGIDPKEICFISFTEASVKATRKKLQLALRQHGLQQKAKDVYINTFNGFGQDIITHHWKDLGFDHMPVLQDKIEQMMIIEDLVSKTNVLLPDEHYQYPFMNQKNYQGIVVALMHYFSFMKAANVQDCQTVQNLLDCNAEKADQLFYLYNLYQQELIRACIIEYQDQELLIFKMLSLNPNLFRQEYAFKHIVVDEFQDSSKGQMLIVKNMIDTPVFQSLMVVGDDLQSIYGFRGACVQNIIDLPKLLDKDVVDFYLIDNYRSTPEIISVANRIATTVKNRIPKNLISKADHGTIPKMYAFEDAKEETPFIADKIATLIASGINPSDICYLAFSKSELDDLADKLEDRGINYSLEVPIKLLDNSYVKGAIGLAQYMTDYNNSKGLYLYLNALYSNQFNNAELGIDLLYRNMRALGMVFDHLDEDERKIYFLNMIALLGKNDPVYQVFREEINKRLNKTLYSLLNYVTKYETYQSDAETRIQGASNAVALSTFHSAKGLEWSHVFMSLSKLGSHTADDEDEIRRLIFVGSTRAKKTLCITSCLGGNKKNEKGKMEFCEHMYMAELRDCGINTVIIEKGSSNLKIAV